MIDITGLREDKRPQSSTIVHALLDRLEAAEKERDDVAQQLVQSEIGKREISEAHDALQVEVGKLKGLEASRCVKINGYIVDNARLAEEVERLRIENEALRAEVIHIKEVEFPRKAQAVADGWRGKLEAAEKERDAAELMSLAQRAKIAEMEKQEPVGTLHDDGCFVWRETAPHQSNYAGWKMALYALPGAKGEEK